MAASSPYIIALFASTVVLLLIVLVLWLPIIMKREKPLSSQGFTGCPTSALAPAVIGAEYTYDEFPQGSSMSALKNGITLDWDFVESYS